MRFLNHLRSTCSRSREGSASENGAVFTGEHEPHGTGILRVRQHPNTHCQPHAVATTTHDFLTDRIPEQEDREDDGRFQTDRCRRVSGPPLRSPQAGGEGSARVEVEELGGVALEGVTIRHRSPHGVLEFLIAAGNAGASLQLVGPERGGQQVGQVVVPHGRHLQVLEEGDRVQGTDSRTSAILLSSQLTDLSSRSGFILPSCVQTPGSATPAPAGC